MEKTSLAFKSAIDTVDRRKVSGWAFDPSAPESRVAVLVTANDKLVGRVVAENYREDLRAKGLGDGRHGFSVSIGPMLDDDTDYVIVVTRESDGQHLDGSPRTLKALTAAPISRTPEMRRLSIGEAPGDLSHGLGRPLGTLIGCLDSLTRTRVQGWAMEEDYKGHHVPLVVTANDKVIARILANRHRSDLENESYGDGRHAFDALLPELSALTTYKVCVRRQTDGAELPGSPRMLPASSVFDADTRNSIAAFLANLHGEKEEAEAIDFLIDQADQLRARAADRASSKVAREEHALSRRRWGTSTGDEGRAVAPRLRVLVIDDKLPVVGRDAGSAAILSHMRALKTLGYEVAFTASTEMLNRIDAATLAAAEGIAIYTAPFYSSVEDVLKRQADSFEVVYLHRLSNAGNYLQLVRAYQPRAQVVFSVADLHHVRIARQGVAQKRNELIEASRYIALREITMARMADIVITHSPVEARMLGEHMDPAKIHIVPWAVPPRPTAVPFAERSGVAMIGQFGHPPNPDAVFWFTRHVMPLVWTENPTIPCHVAGHGWTADKFKNNDPRVMVVGQVDDLAEVFEKVRLTVAPLRFGAGIKGKVLESLAAGVPCVMSPVAAEGISLPPPLSELVVDDEHSMARAILRFHEREEVNAEASSAGLALIGREFTEGRVAAALSGAILPARNLDFAHR